MGQKDKARQIIEEQYNFRTTTSADPDAVYAIADRVASNLNLRFGASLARDGQQRASDGANVAFYQLKGPGGFVTVASLGLTTRSLEDGTAVELLVHEFSYQKGALGMKPTINGSKELGRFVQALKVELEIV